MAEIEALPTVSLPTRKLRANTLNALGVKVGLSREDGKTPAVTYWPYTKDGVITGYKAKTIGDKKQIWNVGSLAGVDLFGWQQAIAIGAKRLIITEGEEDATALRQIIDKHTKAGFEDYKPAVVSLQFGAGSAKKVLPKLVPKLRKHFQEFVLCFDDDKPGRDATLAANKCLPEAKEATLPYNDANECLLKGATRAAFVAVTFKMEAVKNTRIIWARELHKDAGKPAEFGELTWPWPSLNDATRGIRYGETIYIGAAQKMGKSEVVDSVSAHFVQNHGIKVLMAKPEQVNFLTIKKMAGKIAGKVFHDPKVLFDQVAYDKTAPVMNDNVALIDLYQHMGWKTLKEDIEAAAHAGVKAVFIDPITNLTNGMNAAEANVQLQAVAQELSAMAMDLNIVMFIFCHLKATEGNISMDRRLKFYNEGKYTGLGNCPHTMGGDVFSDQFAGSRAMARSCNYMLSLEGNKDPNVPDEFKNIRNLKLLEDREFGESLVLPLYWNRDTTLFTEV